MATRLVRRTRIIFLAGGFAFLAIGVFALAQGGMIRFRPLIAAPAAEAAPEKMPAAKQGTGKAAGPNRILDPRGMGSTKVCSPSPASGGASIQCLYTMQNLDPTD